MAEEPIRCACEDPKEFKCRHHAGACGSLAKLGGFRTRAERHKAATTDPGTPLCVPCAGSRVAATPSWYIRALPGLWSRG